MADSKITALTAISTVDPTADPLVIVDVSDTSMAASGTTKKSTINQLLGSGGTATLASATITGDLTVDTSTLKVDSANDAVGIGTTSPTTYGAKLAVIGSGNGILAVGQASSYTTFQSNGQDFYLNMKGSGSTIFRLGSGDTTAMTLNSTGLNVANGNLILGTSGKGIDFSATSEGSGTMTSELLNDYEEGTWVGTLKGGTTDPTIAVTATGRYTKIGRVVTVTINFNNVITTGASGAVSVTGLPFTNNASNTAQGALLHSEELTFTGSPFLFIEASESILQFKQSISNSPTTNCTHNAGTGRYVQATITYSV